MMSIIIFHKGTWLLSIRVHVIILLHILCSTEARKVACIGGSQCSGCFMFIYQEIVQMHGRCMAASMIGLQQVRSNFSIHQKMPHCITSLTVIQQKAAFIRKQKATFIRKYFSTEKNSDFYKKDLPKTPSTWICEFECQKLNTSLMSPSKDASSYGVIIHDARLKAESLIRKNPCSSNQLDIKAIKEQSSVLPKATESSVDPWCPILTHIKHILNLQLLACSKHKSAFGKSSSLGPVYLQTE